MGLDLLESEFKDKKKSSMEEIEDGKGNKESSDEIDEWCVVLSDIKENAHAAVGILTDLLNYDRIEAGAMKLELSLVRMWDVVEQTVNQFKIQAANRKINLNLTMDKAEKVESGSDCSIHPASISVIGDDTRLRQVIRNLISNALVSISHPAARSMSFFLLPNCDWAHLLFSFFSCSIPALFLGSCRSSPRPTALSISMHLIVEMDYPTPNLSSFPTRAIRKK
jgi:hypothetical protein